MHLLRVTVLSLLFLSQFGTRLFADEETVDLGKISEFVMAGSLAAVLLIDSSAPEYSPQESGKWILTPHREAADFARDLHQYLSEVGIGPDEPILKISAVAYDVGTTVTLITEFPARSLRLYEELPQFADSNEVDEFYRILRYAPSILIYPLSSSQIRSIVRIDMVSSHIVVECNLIATEERWMWSFRSYLTAVGTGHDRE